MYISHIFSRGDSFIGHYTSRMTIFHLFSNNYPTAFIYHMWIPAVISMCVAYIRSPRYIHMERTWGWGRSNHFSQRYIFCLHTWYNMDDVLYTVCLCGGAQGKESFLRTKQRRTPDQIYIYMEWSRSRTEVWKPRVVMPGTWCRVWFIVRVCDNWCTKREWLYS